VLWQLLLAGPLAVVGALTVRVGLLATRGRLRTPGHDDPRVAAATRVAGRPIAVAGVVALAGGLVAVLQPTLPAMLTVAAIAWIGAIGLAVAARRLAGQAITRTTQTAQADQTAQATMAGVACAGCPLTGPARTACCSRP